MPDYTRDTTVLSVVIPAYNEENGIAEIVVVRSPSVTITTLDGRVIYGPVVMPSGAGGGPPTVGDFDGNVARIADFAARAAGMGADVVVFPELVV